MGIEYNLPNSANGSMMVKCGATRENVLKRKQEIKQKFKTF